MLELARLPLDFRFVPHAQAFREQKLRQAVAADDIGSALPPAVGHLDDGSIILCN